MLYLYINISNKKFSPQKKTPGGEESLMDNAVPDKF